MFRPLLCASREERELLDAGFLEARGVLSVNSSRAVSAPAHLEDEPCAFLLSWHQTEQLKNWQLNKGMEEQRR